MVMMRVAEPIHLSDEERETLTQWIRGRALPTRLTEQAQMIQLAAEGVTNQDIA